VLCDLASFPTRRSSDLRRAVEGLFLLTLALATYLLIALFSYDRNDPAWSSVTDVQQVQNAAGTSGAWIADVLFSLVGYVAFLFPDRKSTRLNSSHVKIS